MNNSFKVLQVLGIVAFIAVVGVAVGILVTKGKEDSAKPGVAGPGAPETGSNLVAPPPVTLAARRPLTTTPAPIKTAGRTNLEVTPGNGNVITNWEDRLDEVLGAETDEKQKAQQLLAMFPNLNEEGQIEVAQHLSNLVEDEDFPALASYATNSALPESVLDVLLSDALNRPNTMKLPLLLEIAQNPNHPKATEAKDLLELYLEEDYGNDWARWTAQMEAWLKDNPE
jgi:hypothetical protein